MAKSNTNNAKKQSYISVPSQIINSLSSSSLQSLLVSPKKYNTTNTFFKGNKTFSCRSPRVWLFALFLFGLVGMLRLGWNVNTLIPFSPYPNNPCLQTQPNTAQKHDSMSLVADNFVGQQQPSNNESAEFWEQPDGLGYKPCLDFSSEYRRTSDVIVRDRTKYLLVVVSGGISQQRNQIVDAVVIPRILGAALVVPILQFNVIWGDDSEFSDVFDLGHFKSLLEDIVLIAFYSYNDKAG